MAIYDSSEKHSRTAISVDDLLELPLTDEAGQEINVYDEDGFRIPRRTPLHHRHCPPCGILLDLSQAYTLFQSPYSHELSEAANAEVNLSEEFPQVKLSVYPQAFLKKFGHLQSDGPPLGFQDLLHAINQKLVHNHDGDSTPIQIVAFQGYNYVQHNLAERAGQLEVVKGRVTAALAGTHATGSNSLRTFNRMKGFVSHHLPHDRIEELLNKDNPARAMRFEVVVAINISSLKVHFQSGGCIHISSITSCSGIN